MKSLKLIESLSNLHGISGHEDDIIEFIRNNIEGVITERDSLNNLYITNKIIKNAPIVAIDAHSDEVGFIVERINRNGTISFLPVGGWVTTNIPAHAVIIKNFNGEFIEGIVGTKPPHFMSQDELNRVPKIDELVIDIGTSTYEETTEIYGIEVGNPITPDVNFKYNEKLKIMKGKAFDNRLGCSIVVQLMEDIPNLDLSVTPVGIISSQEEIGLRGAKVAANKIKPDFIIVFEASPADDTFKDSFSSKGSIGKGIQLRVIDGTMIANHRVQKFVKEIAVKNSIPTQIIARNSGGTNAGGYHTACCGIPSIVIGIPTRYIHTHYGYASKIDYDNALLLGKKILENLTRDIINKF